MRVPLFFVPSAATLVDAAGAIGSTFSVSSDEEPPPPVIHRDVCFGGADGRG
jgi:hypothetical protein